jgi:hypothetical protein
MGAALREPQRPLLFVLAVLIHVGLFQSDRQEARARRSVRAHGRPTLGDWKDE